MTIAQQLGVKQFPFTIKDDAGNGIYHEDSTGYWLKRDYDVTGNMVYYEDSLGRIVDKRLKPWRQDLITQMEEMVSRLEEDGLYALRGIKDAITELKKPR